MYKIFRKEKKIQKIKTKKKKAIEITVWLPKKKKPNKFEAYNFHFKYLKPN